MFPFYTDVVLLVSAMLIITFFAVFGLSVIKNQADAESINKKIKAGEKKDNEQNN